MLLHRYDLGYDLGALRADAERATANWRWSRGAYGHALSLPHAGQLHPSARYRYENAPFTGLLDDCPYFREIFDSFACDKTSFRLLRRAPGTSYTWHTDRSKGPGVARFQVPIVADDRAQLIVTDFDSVEELGDLGGDSHEIPHPEDILRAAGGRARAYPLEPGLLFYFNSLKVHTLVNASDRERITLSFDLAADARLLERFPQISGEVGDPPPGIPAPSLASRWGGYCLSRLYPLRNVAQRLLGRQDRPTAGPSSDPL